MSVWIALCFSWLLISLRVKKSANEVRVDDVCAGSCNQEPTLCTNMYFTCFHVLLH